MKRWKVLAFALGALFGVLTALPAEAAKKEWSQFRGAGRDGVARGEKGLARTWPDSGPRVVWQKEIGPGFSGMSIADGQLFTGFAEDGKEFVGAFDADSGDETWRTAIGENFENEFGDGPRSTPTVADGRLYVLSSNGQFHALNAKNGEVLWTVDFVETYGAGVPTFGYSSAPLVDEDLVVMEVGAPEGNLFYAFDVKSGEEQWGALEGRPGYSSPILSEFGGTTQFVFAGQTEVFALDREGEKLWSYEWPRGTIASPVPVGKDRIFISASSDVGGAMLRIKKGGEGFEVEEVWRNREMKNHFSSSVVVDGAIYGFDGATFKAISVADGTRLWAKRGLGKGSLIAADDLLFALGDDGELVLVDAKSKTYSQTGSVQVMDDKSWTSPSIADGKLYVRNVNTMVCLDVKG